MGAGTSRHIAALREAVIDRAPASVVRTMVSTVRACVDIEPFDRGMTLAAQAFTSVFPLLIALSAVLPSSRSLADAIADNLQLPSSTREVLEEAMGSASASRGVFGVVGVLVVLVSGTSYARALARMYGRVWRTRPVGWRGAWRWVVLLVGLVLAAVALRAIEHSTAVQPFGPATEAVVTLALDTAFWIWVPWLLLTGQVGWRALLPGGLLMGLSTLALSTVSTVYLRLALVRSAEHYGSLGVAFTYISWLFVVSFVLVVTTAMGATLVREIAPLRRWARLDATEQAEASTSLDRNEAPRCSSQGAEADRGSATSERGGP